jgi:uncharacterized protein (DUF169 family)
MTNLLDRSDYSMAAVVLAESLTLRQPPVAICFTDSVPPGVNRVAGRVPAGCRFWQDAAAAAFATSASDHSVCAIGVYAHNLQPSPAQQVDLADALRVFSQLEYVREEDLALIPVLHSQPQYVVYSPLAQTPLPPDVIILFVNANQTLILSEATQQVENQNAPAMGRPACAVVPQVPKPRMLWSPCVLGQPYGRHMFAIPGAKLGSYAERIQALAKANLVLSRFHQTRRRDILDRRTPTVQDSLAAMSTG